MNTLLRKVSARLERLLRLPRCRRLRRGLRVSDLTLLTNNCLGGLLYHELGLPFLSPLINIYMNNADFLSLCADLPGYLALPLTFVDAPDAGCPVATLGTLTIKFPHASTGEQARADWERRKARIRYDRLYVIFLDIGNATQQERAAFDALPQANRLYVRHAAREHGGRAWYERERGALARRGYDRFPLLDFLNDPVRFGTTRAAEQTAAAAPAPSRTVRD